MASTKRSKPGFFDCSRATWRRAFVRGSAIGTGWVIGQIIAEAWFVR